MGRVISIFWLLNTLSLDVAAGAVVGAAFFAGIMEVDVLPQAFVALGLTVWAIYTADHLLDALVVKRVASSRRHRFHQEYFSVLAWALALVILVDLFLVLFIRRPVLMDGLVFAVVVGLYLAFSRWLTYCKEVAGAILYTGGVLLPAWSLHPGGWDLFQKILAGKFFLVALLNLLLFAWLDSGRDESDGQKSLATAAGLPMVKKVIAILFIAFFALSAWPVNDKYATETWVLTTMGAVLFFLFFFSRYFGRDERFRLVGDAVFLVPLISFAV